MNTGNLALHLHIRRCIPSTVADFEVSDGTYPFKPIKLCGALLDPSDFYSVNHGILSTVVRYHTIYSTIDGTNVLLCLHWALIYL